MRRWIVGVAGVQVAIRVGVVLGAMQLASADVRALAIASIVVGALYALQGAARAVVRRGARRNVVARSAAALFGGDVLRGSPIADQDAEFAVFDALHLSEQLAASVVPDMFGDAIACLAIGGLIVWTVPARIVLLASSAIAVGALGVMVARRTARRAQQELERVAVPVFEALVAAVRGRLDIVASGREPEHQRELDTLSERWTATAARVDRTAALAGRAPMIAAAAGAGLVILIDESMRGGLRADAFARAALLAAAVPPFAGVARAAIALARMREQLRPFEELVTAPARVSGGAKPSPALTTIAFDAVNFTYPNGVRPALEELSFAFDRPGLTAFTGPNGSGKSTCLRLLLGLAAPSRGRVLIGGADLLGTDLLAWRRRIAYLPQRPFLPERATVRSAIRLLAIEASDASMSDALARVELLDMLVAQAPDAPLDVPVATLSIGQRQRVAIARALSMNAELLVFDEPDANLDIAGVARLARVLREAAADRIVVVAAHTEELVGAADSVVRLSGGRVA